MFRLCKEPLNISELNAGLLSDRAGALVVFEGRVRDHNEGRAVLSLEYEAYEELALKEGAGVVEDALKNHDVIDVHCVHRVGKLEIGEPALWVGVLSAHRREAFEACQFVIDQVKERVPVWKKEHYVEGDAGWLDGHPPGSRDDPHRKEKKG